MRIKPQAINDSALWVEPFLMGILLCNAVCWAAFALAGLGGYSQAALSWMFRHSKLLWPLLLNVSILLILDKNKITSGVLVGDDSDQQRAKVTQRIFATAKHLDKKTGGWFNGQSVVLLFFVRCLAVRGFMSVPTNKDGLWSP